MSSDIYILDSQNTISMSDKSVKVHSEVTATFKEDIIYESTNCKFLCGESLKRMTLVNRLNLYTHTSSTLAWLEYTSGDIIEKSSNDIVHLIGQEAYDTVFSSLCSVINQELKVRGILALLTVPKRMTVGDATKVIEKPKPSIVRRKRRKQAPYVVKDEQKKVVIPPKSFPTFLQLADTIERPATELQDIKGRIFDENSNDSSISKFSVASVPELFKDPVSLLENVDRHTELLPVQTACVSKGEETTQFVGRRPTANMSLEERKKFHLMQALIDYKSCLAADEDGNFPIHHAVVNSDKEWLRRQCLMLKIRNESVDILTPNNMSALMMSLYQENALITSMLLFYGADPLLADDDHRTAFHIAAEMEGGHLKAIINYCKKNARRLLQDEVGVWKPEYETKQDSELTEIYFKYACSLTTNQGYSPLMLASKLGKFENVQLLLDIVSDKAQVNAATPSSGETSLYIAVGAAIINSVETGDKSKVTPHFKKTLNILIQNGADPNLANYSNSNVHDLVQESACAELCQIIGNAVTSKLSSEPLTKDFGSLMLLKEKDEPIKIKDMKKNTRKPLSKAVTETVTSKPSIVTQPGTKTNTGFKITKPVTMAKKSVTRNIVPGIHPNNSVTNMVPLHTNMIPIAQKNVNNVTHTITKPVFPTTLKPFHAVIIKPVTRTNTQPVPNIPVTVKNRILNRVNIIDETVITPPKRKLSAGNIGPSVKRLNIK